MVASPIQVPSNSPTICEFTYNSKQYCSKNALWLARCARLVYQEPANIEAQVKEWGFNNFRFFDKNDTQVFVMGNDHLIVIAFRGTTSVADWMTNRDISLVPAFGGKVHCGFYTALKCVWDDLEATLKEFQTNNQRILVTGHSLGAALATLATATLLEKNMTVLGLYTFGSPRAGDETFANAFNAQFKAQTFRFVNNNDVVTRVAPRSLSYGHVGTFIYFDRTGAFQSKIEYWNQFLDSVKGGLEDFLKPGMDSIKDHDMGMYEQHLLKNMDKLLS